MHFSNDPSTWFYNFFIRVGFGSSLSPLLSTFTLVIIVIFLSWFANFIAKVIIRKVVTKIVKKTSTTWDDIFLEQKVFTRLSHLAPALVIWFMAGWALEGYDSWQDFVQNLSYVYMVLAGTIFLTSFIEAWHQIYNTLPISQHRHIKGYVQLVKIFVIVVAVLVVISVIFGKDIRVIVTGLGAMAAVLILVFKDTLLGLVASIQLSVNNMVKIGDWITIRGREIDGTVTDITLNTVKVQNFDKTIITLPTYSLVNDSFQNWKGMEEAGVRQIKRSILIDLRSIRFLDDELRSSLISNESINESLIAAETAAGGKVLFHDRNGSPFPDAPITNLAVFRFYAERYLRNHRMIDTEQAIIVRHREPQSNGLPLQVYAFTRNNQLTTYESVQAEIFEHLLAIISLFGLRVFQEPGGHDLVTMKDRNSNQIP
jgi:miniconductance mechanosensitive channel